MDLSIIIVNYNTINTTAACIDRLAEQTNHIQFEIIVVDNASTDGSREYFSNEQRITYIYHHENIGFGRANNLGLQKARGRNILFLNPDTLLLNNATAILSCYLDTHSNVAVVGGNLYNRSMQPALSFRKHRPSIWWEINLFLCYLPDRIFHTRNWFFNHAGRSIRVGYITGADLMARREDLLAIKGFGEEFFAYYEDTDLCQRLNSYGRIISVPQARIQHLEGDSFEQSATNSRRIILSEQGRHIYYHRNHTHIHHIIANHIYMLTLRLHGFIHQLLKHTARHKECLLRLRIVKDLQRSI